MTNFRIFFGFAVINLFLSVALFPGVPSQTDLYVVYGGYSFSSDYALTKPNSKDTLRVRIKAGRRSIATKQPDGLIAMGGQFFDTAILRHRKWHPIRLDITTGADCIQSDEDKKQLGDFYAPFHTFLGLVYRHFTTNDVKISNKRKNGILEWQKSTKPRAVLLAKGFSTITKKTCFRSTCKFCLRRKVNGKMRVIQAVPVSVITFSKVKDRKDQVVTKALFRLELFSKKTSEITFVEKNGRFQSTSIKGVKRSSLWYKCIKNYCKENLRNYKQFYELPESV